VVHHGGVIDTFGDDGHQRSTNGGANWTTAALPLPSGQGSIAASPDEANVIFVSTGQNVYESDNGGSTWTNLGTPDSRRQGRIDFVATNDRAGNAFDLWFGDVSLFRAGCASNPMGGGLRCPVARTGAPASPPPAGWAGPFTRNGASFPPPATQRAHDDAGDIVFDSQAANDACPRLFSSDGGVYFNTLMLIAATGTEMAAMSGILSLITQADHPILTCRVRVSLTLITKAAISTYTSVRRDAGSGEPVSRTRSQI
jgi:hypothetical protein